MVCLYPGFPGTDQMNMHERWTYRAIAPFALNASPISGMASIASRRKGEWSAARRSASERASCLFLRAIRRFHCRKSLTHETSQPFGSFATQMKLERENVAASELHNMDRQVIRVDIPPAHAGIMAALRRAFEAAAGEPCDRDFADLIRKLN